MLIGLNEKAERIRATKNAIAICPECKESLIPKCGDIKIWHWAHKHESNCWYSSHPMTLFHLAWQDLALKQGYDVEVNFKNDDGKIIHRADILTKNNRIVEIQHSDISSKEMIKRSEFYKSKQLLVDWIIDDNKRYNKNKIEYTPYLHPTTKQIQHQIYSNHYPKKYSCLFNYKNPIYGKVIMDFGGIENNPLTHNLFLIHNIHGTPHYDFKCNRSSYNLDKSLRNWYCHNTIIPCEFLRFDRTYQLSTMTVSELTSVFEINRFNTL